MDNLMEKKEIFDKQEKEIIDSYKNVVSFIKNFLSYIIVLTAITILFGYIYLKSFLASDNLWILNTLEYKTIITWGMEISYHFFYISLLVLYYHIELKHIWNKSFTQILFIIQIILFGYLSFYQENYYQFAFTILIAITILLLLLDLTVIVDALSSKDSVINNRFLFIILISLTLLYNTINLYGSKKGKYIKKGNYQTIATIDNQNWGLLINNNSSLILVDLNNTKKIKIIKADNIKYFTNRAEQNTTNK